eukprot:2198622-Rhodomonas_salina.1
MLRSVHRDEARGGKKGKRRGRGEGQWLRGRDQHAVTRGLSDGTLRVQTWTIGWYKSGLRGQMWTISSPGRPAGFEGTHLED